MSDAGTETAGTETRSSADTPGGESRKRPLMTAGLLIIVGLVVEAFTLFWSHPTAFLLFVGIGFGFVVLGILVYLWTVLFAKPEPEPAAG